MVRFRFTATAFALVLVAALGLAEAWRGAPAAPLGAGDPDDPRPPLLDVALASSLERHDGCEDFAAAMRTAAMERVTPWGLQGAGGRMEVVALRAGEEAAVAADSSGSGGATGFDAAAPAEQSAGGPELSGTNVQERGVDEPDLVKTDGRVLAAVARGELQLVDLTGAEPRLAAHLPLPSGWGHELLLRDGRLLVVSNGERQAAASGSRAAPGAADLAMPTMGDPQAVLTLYDVRDPAAPRELGTVRIDGQAVTSRLVDGTVRLVLRSHPQPVLGAPEPLAEQSDASAQRRAEREALERNKELLRQTDAEDWLPRFETVDAGGERREGPLVACDQVHYPAEFSGFGMVSVLAVPLDGPLTPQGSASVAGDGDIVYATTDRLYVAINRWTPIEGPEPAPADPAADPAGEPAILPDIAPAPGMVRAEIHEFDISDPEQPVYTASGSVPGHLLNQWALSAHDGHLRVATTEGETVGMVVADGGAPATESAVRVLRREGAALVEVGKVDGLGKGERIYAVRYFGPIGFVVTFRQTDPLYTLDLSDPAAPRVVGELKIPGFSSYLHPVGEGLLLGVGYDADEQTGQRLGVQVSLFDVRDLADPRRVSQVRFEEQSMTEVEHDHRAFLWWRQADRVVVPYQAMRWDEATQRDTGFMGAVALALEGGLREVGRIRHSEPDEPEPWLGQIRRAVVIDGALYTVSERGLMASTLDELRRTGWVEFAGGGNKGGVPVD